ncbi:MAG: sulfur carrier protein ThiS [Verrucomicrobia bacterium]|nr:sulfur carrier protein ThiS [Verrucomicrobiota bacterium]
MNPNPMTIILNGTPHQLAAPVTLAALLDSLGLGGKPVVVELNEVAVFPRDYALTPVTEGARLEVVSLAAGG